MRGTLAGIAAAAVWAAVEPALARTFGIPWYSDRRLLAGLLGVGSEGGLAAHLANGAIFGAVFERAGARGPFQGMAAAQAENLALWPAMAVVDRVHPERRSRAWPPLLTNGRVFAYEAAAHALFGAVLGTLIRQREPSSP
jgi:hypothetical protein